MPIVGGLDIHRKQLTFDYLGTETGEVKRGQIALADRTYSPAPGWCGSPAGTHVAFGAGGAHAGWRYVAEGSLAGPVSRRMSPSPAETPLSLAAASGTPRRTGTATRGSRGIAGRGPAAGGRRNPAVRSSWSAGRCWRRTTLRRLTHRRVQRIHAAYFDQGAPAWVRAAWRTDDDPRGAARGGRGAPVCGRAAAGGHRAGHARRAGGAPATRRGAPCRPDAARGLTGPGCSPPGCTYRVGLVTAPPAMTSWPGRRLWAFSSRKAVRFAGLDITVWSSDRKGPPGRSLSGRARKVPRLAAHEAGRPARPRLGPRP